MTRGGGVVGALATVCSSQWSLGFFSVVSRFNFPGCGLGGYLVQKTVQYVLWYRNFQRPTNAHRMSACVVDMRVGVSEDREVMICTRGRTKCCCLSVTRRNSAAKRGLPVRGFQECRAQYAVNWYRTAECSNRGLAVEHGAPLSWRELCRRRRRNEKVQCYQAGAIFRKSAERGRRKSRLVEENWARIGSEYCTRHASAAAPFSIRCEVACEASGLQVCRSP